MGPTTFDDYLLGGLGNDIISGGDGTDTVDYSDHDLPAGRTPPAGQVLQISIGGEDDERSKKVKIPHSSAIVKGIAEGTITWTRDPDFGYEVATHVPGIEEADLDILQPRRLYEATGRLDDYNAHVERLKRERVAELEKYPDLKPEIVDAIR